MEGERRRFWKPVPLPVIRTPALVTCPGCSTRIFSLSLCLPAVCTGSSLAAFIKVNDRIFPVECCQMCVSVGDKSALRPSGLRFGSPALTSRGLVQDDFKKVAEFIHRGIPQKYMCSDPLGLIRLKNVRSSSHLPFVCSYHADPGGAGKPWSQGSSERIYSSIEAWREVPAASSRN